MNCGSVTSTETEKNRSTVKAVYGNITTFLLKT